MSRQVNPLGKNSGSVTSDTFSCKTSTILDLMILPVWNSEPKQKILSMPSEDRIITDLRPNFLPLCVVELMH